MIRWAFAVVATVFLALLAFTYAGALHPAGDSFAVFRLEIALAAAFFTIWTAWSHWLRRGLVALCFAVVLAILAPQIRPALLPDRPSYTLYQQNLLFTRRQDEAWLAEVKSRQPDLITLQEVSGRNKALLEALESAYPTQQYCDFATVGGTAVLSRFPAIEGSAFCAGRKGMSAIRPDTPEGPLWLVSVHLHWPWPYGQAAQVNTLLPALDKLEGAVVLAGDFNSVGWSSSLRRIARAIGAKRLRHGGESFSLPIISKSVTIDHVLSNLGAEGGVLTLPRHGSDHNGLWAALNRAH